MKKLLVLFLVVLLTSCSSGKTTIQKEGDGVSVNKGSAVKVLEDKTITLPFSFYQSFQKDISKEEIIQGIQEQYATKEGIVDFKINEDSVTFTIKGSEVAKYQEELKKNINSGISSLISEGNFGIEKVVYNDSVTEFEVTIKGEEVALATHFSLFFFYLSGGIYQLFNGTKSEDIQIIVKFMNAEGKVLETADSKEFAKNQ